MRLVFDIEADALLSEVTRVWCICCFDLDKRTMYSFRPNEIDKGLDLLSQADLLIGHFILGYDIPVLQKLHGWKPGRKQTIRDTLAISRLAYSNLREHDLQSPDHRVKAMAGGASKLGDHSLAAWGVRLGRHKIEFQDFSQFSEEMLKYNEQDVLVNVDLWHRLEAFAAEFEADVNLEQRIMFEYERMGNYGIRFDVDRCHALVADIDQRTQETLDRISALIPGKCEELSTPAYWRMHWPDGTTTDFPSKTEAEGVRKSRKLRPGECVLERGPNKVRHTPFNPGSGKQVRDLLVEKYNWISPQLTDTGNNLLKAGGDYTALAKQYGSTSEEYLRLLDYPEAVLCADYAVLKKIKGMVGSVPQKCSGEDCSDEGTDSAWLSCVGADGRLRFRLHHIGCITHRSSSTSPNLQQTPSVVLGPDKKPVWGFDGRYGCDCRALFLPSEGYALVGVDLSGIEGRMLAHYLAAYDGGAYIQQILQGDVHQLNADSIKQYAGYAMKRGDTKPCYYGLLYGIGAEKQGRGAVAVSPEARADWQDRSSYYEKHADKIQRFTRIGSTKVPMRPSDCAFADVGEKVNTAMAQGIDGFQGLTADVKRASKRGYLKVLGRQIPVEKEHAALNTLLQGGAGVIAKRWIVRTADQIRRNCLDARLLLAVHDEVQAEARPEIAQDCLDMSLAAIRWAGEYYQLKLPLAGEGRIGSNWQETH